jgi:type I restriction enzyme M protein
MPLARKIAKVKVKTKTNGKTFSTQQSLNNAIWDICNILRRSNCASALQYIPELTWILFLRILDEQEHREAEEAEAVGVEFKPSIKKPYRWQDWAAPDAKKRKELSEGALGAFFAFVNTELIPYLQKLKDKPNATPRQKVISQIMSGVERTRIDTEKNMFDVLDRVHVISNANIDRTHIFALSQVYEGLLLKMGEKANDGGQFFTPRVIIRVVVRVVKPKIGKPIYDPTAGTGGFFAEANEYMIVEAGGALTAEQIETLKYRTFYGREKDNLIYPITLANLVLHGIDQPNIWHGNTLTGQEIYGGLFQNAPALYAYVFTNPPFGGKEGKEAQTGFSFKTGATQVLILQHVIDSLENGGESGIVLDEGVLFRTNETAFVQTKRKLLDDCNLWCIVSLPGGVFTAAGAGVKTNLLFFKKGTRTEKIWYYDLSDIKVGKKTPLTMERFDDFFRLLPTCGDSERSWTVDMIARRANAKHEADPLRAQATKPAGQAAQIRQQIKKLKDAKNGNADVERITQLEADARKLEADVRELTSKADAIENAVYDLKAVNPNAKDDGDARKPEELIALIRAKGKEVDEALAVLEK